MEQNVYERLPVEIVRSSERENRIDDVLDLIGNCLHDVSRRSRKTMESKLRRRALLLTSNPKTLSVQRRKKYSSKKLSRKAQGAERALRENELKTWDDTTFLRRLWQKYAKLHEKKLAYADLHGACIVVLAPTAYRGICGVILEESAHNFRVLDRRLELIRLVPKSRLHFALFLQDPGPSLDSDCLLLQGHHRNALFPSSSYFKSVSRSNATLAQQKLPRPWAPSIPLFPS